MLREDLVGPHVTDDYGSDTYLIEAPPPPRGRWWKHGLYIIFALLVLLLGWLLVTAPLSKSLQPIAPPAITLLSADGDPIARRGADTDRPVDVTQLPAHVPGAFLAIEDRRFYRHWGVDPRGIVRAAWNNLQAGGVRQGGSTISQQLAKLVFLTAERTAGRKLQEVILAFWLEAWLTKDELLSRYLSSVYFGDNVYGLRAAARYYFSRDPDELTVPQAAMLAGLVKAPSRLAPTRNLDGAQARSRLVMNAMAETGLISRTQADALRPATLKVSRRHELPAGTYFADWAFPKARARGEAGYGEQSITTTLDDDLQRLAVGAVRRARLGGAQIALVAMRSDGTVVAMVGGRSYKDSSFNRATQARRQPGSTFKLFVYLAALREGLDPESMVEDTPLTIGNWSPRNNSGRYRGPINLREAFAVSSNVAAVRLQEQVGRDKVIRAARDLGITAPLTDDASLALGTSGVSLIEMTAAYAAVAAERRPVQPHALPRDGDGGWLGSLRNGIRSFRDRGNFERLQDLLHAAANDGTGRAAALRVDTFGKTGTSQDHRDAIFIGFAGDLVTGVWVGNDDNSPLKGVEGGGLPARIWRDFMSRAVGGAPVRAEPVRRRAREELPAVSVPIEGTDIEVGIDLADNSFSISAGEKPPLDPVEDDVPTFAPPPSIIVPEEEEPPFEDGF